MPEAVEGRERLSIEEDAGTSGKALTGRPALDRALAAAKAGDADVLVAAKLDRFSRSVLDFALMIDRASGNGGRSRPSTWTLT